MFTTRAYQTLCLKIDQKPVAARMRIDETAHSALLSGPVSLSLSLSWPAAGRVNNSTSKIFIPGCTVHRISNVRLATDMNEGDKMEVLHQQEESSLENGGESTDLYCMAMHAAPSPCNRYFCSLAIMALSCREGSVVAKIKLVYSLHRVSACWCSMKRGRDRSMWLTASRV